MTLVYIEKKFIMPGDRNDFFGRHSKYVWPNLVAIEEIILEQHMRSANLPLQFSD